MATLAALQSSALPQSLTMIGGAVLLSVGAVLLYKRLRTRSRAKAERSQGDMSQPMISSFNQSRFSFHSSIPVSPLQTYQPPTRPPVSPQMSSGSGSSSYHDSSSGSSSGHSHTSPLSDQGSAFHFPLLSADGHLMPPVPASSRQQTWNISEGDLGSGRPLPNAPGTEEYGNANIHENDYEYEQYAYDYSPNPSYEGYEGIDEKATMSYYEQEDPAHMHLHLQPPTQTQHLVAPTPRTPKRWSYEPPHSTPSPERSDDHAHEVVGLYPSIEFRGDGSIDYGYGHGRGVDDHASIRSSPRVAQVQDTFGFHQPQSATYHRSFSAEGEEIMADR